LPGIPASPRVRKSTTTSWPRSA